MSKIVPKVWGEEHWLVNREYCGKRLLLKEGFRCSRHFHKIKHETFYLLSGRVLLELGEETMLLEPGAVVEITPGAVHRFTGLAASEIIEFSTHHMDEDSYRETESGAVPPAEWATLCKHYR